MHGFIYCQIGSVTELVQTNTGGGEEFVKSLQFQCLILYFFFLFMQVQNLIQSGKSRGRKNISNVIITVVYNVAHQIVIT
jgi:hypothetical protein